MQGVIEFYQKILTDTIMTYITSVDNTLESFEGEFTNALNNFREQVDNYYKDTMGAAIDGQYNYNENGEMLNESNVFLMSGVNDPLFPVLFNMNTEFDNPPTILNCLISAPTGTQIQYNLGTIKTITSGVDASSVEQIGATYTQYMGFLNLPFGRQVTELEQAKYTIFGPIGQECEVHFLGWNK